MNITNKGERFYWHVQIFKEDSGYMLVRKKGQRKINLNVYRIE